MRNCFYCNKDVVKRDCVVVWVRVDKIGFGNRFAHIECVEQIDVDEDKEEYEHYVNCTEGENCILEEQYKKENPILYNYEEV